MGRPIRSRHPEHESVAVKFVETPIEGVVVVEISAIFDERGFFARSFSRDAFAERGLMSVAMQSNISLNQSAGTLRGMHYQAEPLPDPKLVRCTAGAMYDVALDLRPESPTYSQWFGTTLTAANRSALHVPAGCAHGFITLEEATEVLYVMGADYREDLSRGVRWNDPAFGIEWPAQPQLISDRDASFPDFET